MDVRMPVLEIKDLSTTFGLDITVPNGGLVASAANQRAYKAECKKIYDDFLLTMSNYFHEETIVKKQLEKLQTQNKGANKANNAVVTGRIYSSAGLRKGGFVTNFNRPKTVQGLTTSTPDFSRHGKGINSIKSAHSVCTTGSYDGVMDQRADYSSDRRVRMKQDVFLKLGSDSMDVKFQNKQGKFIMKPISSKKKAKSTPSTEVPGQKQSQFREKMALVRRRTNFKSPTLSSDLKINNIVAIQRSLQGLPSKRMTVREVMGKAIDRKARMFRVQVDEESGSERNQRINMMTMNRSVDMESDTYYEEDEESYSSDGHGGIRKVEIRENSVYSPGTTDMPDPYMEAGARRFDSLPTTSRSAIEMAIVRLGFHDLPYTVPTAFNSRVSPRGLYMDANRLKGKTFLAYDKNTGVANVSARMTRAPLTISADAMTPRRSKIHSHRDSVAFIKQAQDEDMEREKKLNCWRQRMTFVSLKQGSLARVLSGSGRSAAT
ncbi:uncharacterized protein LOC121371115 [Gigantopelta aegis]|uniref:uncharacterized protein LOC121371115 n=1 Tax=Gigantopelta aegis TaxID=1735272 RepID=UPI001B889B50|nr:uncharacterized protein LOC121371115 [Gigantopelta aegis]